MIQVTHFDERHCHKWALLLKERQQKLNKLLTSLINGNTSDASKLFQEIFFGTSSNKADPGMSGSLLYHMAMVTKMETETRFLIEELQTNAPDVEANLSRFYGDFASDATELTKDLLLLNVDAKEVASRENLSTNQKIDLSLN